jgi:UDP-N-acetylmuramoyl-tripeptide--D-alanyl-D-alanine ligase
MVLSIALVWLIGACLRIYRQARFYQIEEYMSLRYLRWLFGERERWLPARPIVAWLVGSALGVVMSEAPGEILLTIIGALAATFAGWPPREKEVKKAFKRTNRALRMLGGAFVIAGLLMLTGIALVNRFVPDEVSELRFGAINTFGLFVFLLAPFALIAGNLLMTPVEAFLRGQFINRARRTLEQNHPKIIGITGSYGKTSTKNYLTEILNGRFRALPTPKSYNTLMGVCITINDILAKDYGYDYFVVEMGAYIRGEIQRICQLTHPEISMVIEVGPQHLERFGSLENIAIAKYEIIKALPPDGVGIFNWDNPYVREMYERGYPATRLAVSKTADPASPPEDGPRFIALDIQESLEGLSFTVTDVRKGDSQPFITPVIGEHNVINILMATAVAVHEGMSLREVAARVRNLQPAESRLVRQVSPEGITIINDAYSANPAGIVSALRVLGMHQTGKRLLITPGMVELGDLMEAENRKLGQIATQYATHVILVGEQQTKPIKAGLIEGSFPADNLLVVDTLGEAVNWYKSNLQAGDTVLFLNDLPDTY